MPDDALGAEIDLIDWDTLSDAQVVALFTIGVELEDGGLADDSENEPEQQFEVYAARIRRIRTGLE